MSVSSTRVACVTGGDGVTRERVVIEGEAGVASSLTEALTRVAEVNRHIADSEARLASEIGALRLEIRALVASLRASPRAERGEDHTADHQSVSETSWDEEEAGAWVGGGGGGEEEEEEEEGASAAEATSEEGRVEEEEGSEDRADRADEGRAEEEERGAGLTPDEVSKMRGPALRELATQFGVRWTARGRGLRQVRGDLISAMFPSA